MSYWDDFGIEEFYTNDTSTSGNSFFTSSYAEKINTSTSGNSFFTSSYAEKIKYVKAEPMAEATKEEVSLKKLKAFVAAMESMGKGDLAVVREAAIRQYIRRAVFAESHERYDNSELPAGSPVYVYCKDCGIMVDRLPEDYLFPPKKQCSQCAGLEKHGWLDEAQRIFLLEKVAK